jgi:aminoglycoside 3-N-acetyltransferase
MTTSPRPPSADDPSEQTGASRDRLRSDLEELGVPQGASVLLHASLRRIRPDSGGAATVVAALLGEHGTLLVPTQTTWNSPTSQQYLDATSGLSAQEIEECRARRAAFDPLTTPSAGMGAVAEYVRTMPGAARSTHPHSSFAAVGAGVRRLTTPHDLDCHLGERSPLGTLYQEQEGWILHLGTGYQVSTIFHLAEYRYTELPIRTYEARIPAQRPAAGRVPHGDGWVAFEDIEFDGSDFSALGADFEAHSGVVHRGRAGSARAILYPARAAADYAVAWMRRERSRIDGLKQNPHNALFDRFDLATGCE